MLIISAGCVQFLAARVLPFRSASPRCWFELEWTCAPSAGAGGGDTVGGAEDRGRDCLCKAISRHCACVSVGVGVGRITEVGSRIK